MANLSNIARPYALAAFEYARENQELQAWRIFLDSAAYMSHQPDVMRLIADPERSTKQLFDLFYQVLMSQINDARKNFLLLLVQNRRLMVLSDIAEAFKTLYAELEKVSTVRVVTAVEIKDDYRQKLSKAISKRIKRDVVLHCEIDSSLLGGAIIHIGDSVIDGSIRGKLTRLLQNLTS